MCAPPDPDAAFTVDTIRPVHAQLDVAIADDFWREVLTRFEVLAVRFSRSLPEETVYRLAAQPELGEPVTLLLPEVWRTLLPPLPRLGSLV
jgi:hypothetical protein